MRGLAGGLVLWLVAAAAPVHADAPAPLGQVEVDGLPSPSPSPKPAKPVVFRFLAAGDFLFATGPLVSGLDDAEASLRLRLDVLHLGAGHVDLKLDFWGRYGFVGNPSTAELRTLEAIIHLGRVDLTLGRFSAPGDFWLIADGARLDIRYTNWLSQSFYGGLRSFTTARDNADLNVMGPVALPLGGTALTVHHRLIDAGLSFTYAKDVLFLNDFWSTQSLSSVPDNHVESEYFLDGHFMLFPVKTLMLAGGGSFGTRYDVQFSPTDPQSPAQVGIATLGAVSAWSLVEWRLHPKVRLQYTLNYERVRMIESQELLTEPNGAPVPNPNGSYLDNQIRVVWLAWRALRIDAQYRFRWRENTDLEHNAVVGIHGDDLWHHFGGFVSVGVDIIQPGVTTLTRIIYSGGLTYLRSFLDIRAGILFTDGLGSGLLFSQPVTGGTGAAPTQLFPYVLETNRVAFLRVFGNWRGWFAGVDVEEDLDLAQLRGLVQVGVAK